VRTMAVVVVLTVLGGVPVRAGLDVTGYRIEAVVHEDRIEAEVTVSAVGKTPAEWKLVLAPEMKVLSADAGGNRVPFTREGARLVLDLEGVRLPKSAVLRVRLRVAGAPSEIRNGRFVRSVVRPDVAYVRSQHPWYPRVPDDPAAYSTTIDVPAEWQVRTAGAFGKPEVKDGRTRWTFESEREETGIGFVAGPWRHVVLPGGGKTTFDVLCRPGHEAAAEVLADVCRRAFTFYGGRFGKIDRPRMTLVEMPKEYGVGSGYGESGYLHVGTGAFEHGGHTGWGAGFVAHETAHLWWGREVTFAHFASEMLAEYSAHEFLEEKIAPEAALRMRREAVERVAAAAGAGKEIAFADIRGWGAGLDPETYRSHAYEKGMMLLVMVEEAVGAKSMRKLLRAFLDAHRGKRVDWAALRGALAAGGDRAAAVLDAWEKPGVPSLTLEITAPKKAGSRWTLAGKLHQEGAPKPVAMAVPFAVVCEGGGRRESTVRITREEAAVSFRTGSRPEFVLVDPDYRLLAARKGATLRDPEVVFGEAAKIVLNPKDRDPDRLARVEYLLRGLLDSGRAESPGSCRILLGRTLFRAGQFPLAKRELEDGLESGGFGPFHRSWALFRLGCIADLEKDRDRAKSFYQAVLALPDRSNLSFQKRQARALMETPYTR